MAYCGPRGIPLSKFLSWRSTDRAAALAWMQHEAGRCSGCGTHQADWDEDPNAYHAQADICLGCLRRHAATEEIAPVHRPAGRVRMVRGLPL